MTGSVDMWYDRQTRSWVVQKKDAEGNQIGDAYYTGSKSDAQKTKESWEKELNPKQSSLVFSNDLPIKIGDLVVLTQNVYPEPGVTVPAGTQGKIIDANRFVLKMHTDQGVIGVGYQDVLKLN